MLKRLLVIVALLVFTGEAMAADAHIYIFAGQSNALGGGVFTAQSSDQYIKLYAELARIDDTKDDFTDYEVPVGDDPTLPRWLQQYALTATNLAPVMQQGALRSGPEVRFSRFIYGKYGAAHNTVIAKYAVSGSGMNQHWMNSRSVDLSDRLITFLSRVEMDVASSGKTPVFSGFVIFQGERDAQGSAADAAAYQDNLTKLVAKVRNFLDLPELPVVVVRTYLTATAPYLATVRAAQEAFVASDVCAAIATADGLALLSDGIHFTPAAHESIGYRQYERMTYLQGQCP